MPSIFFIIPLSRKQLFLFLSLISLSTSGSSERATLFEALSERIKTTFFLPFFAESNMKRDINRSRENRERVWQTSVFGTKLCAPSFFFLPLSLYYSKRTFQSSFYISLPAAAEEKPQKDKCSTCCKRWDREKYYFFLRNSPLNCIENIRANSSSFDLAFVYRGRESHR